MQRIRHIVACVHHALANGRAKACFFDDAKRFKRVIDRLHRQRAGRAAFNHLRDTKPRRSSRGFPVVCSLHRPDTLLQPVNQCQVIRRAAKQCLAEMHVSLHEARQNGAAARIYHNIGSINRCPNACNALPANQQVARHDGIIFIHREQRAVFNENRFFHQRERDNKLA